jgi:hypothetical protein
MAESKSSFFQILINGHSEKSREVDFNSITGFADISECETRSHSRAHQPEPADDGALICFTNSAWPMANAEEL